MNKNYWINRWINGELGWHQRGTEPNLIKQFSGLSPRKIFVPLCGKSYDLDWLMKQGHEVVGVELSKLACEAFFQEHGQNPKIYNQGQFTVFECERLKIYNGDFFSVKARAS